MMPEASKKIETTCARRCQTPRTPTALLRTGARARSQAGGLSMRSTFWARWAACALAITVAMPLALAGGKKSVASCTTFDQVDKDDDKIEMTIRNSCSMPVDCSLRWRVVCAPDAKSRRAAHPKSLAMTIASNTTSATEASAAICGDDSWLIDSVQWSCEPNKD
jgi:hypothetical protein